MRSMEAELLSTSNGKQQQQQGEEEEDEDEEGGAKVLYRASFEETAERLVGYKSTQWVLLSLVLLLAWGVGLLMLLYLPFRRYAVRRDVQSRRLYVTSNAIVYKGCLQTAYGIHSIKIENASRRKPPPGDDLQITGVDDPTMFKKEVLRALSIVKNRASGRRNGKNKFAHDELGDDHALRIPERSSSQNWAWQQGAGLSSWQMSYSPINEVPHENPCIVLGDVLLRKLHDIESSLERIEVLIEPPPTKAMDTPLKRGKEDPYP